MNRFRHTGTTIDGKNPRFLAVNHDSLKKGELTKKVFACKFTLLKILGPGFATAPYKAKSPARNPNAQPLYESTFETVDGQRVPAMRMYTYPKVGMYDKGPRSDLSWTLVPGNTVKLWLDEERINDATLFLTESIPAFSLCEITVQSKNEESVKKGWCFKITSVRLAEFSFHSIQKDLQCLSSNLGDARTREILAKSAQPMLEKELETQVVAYWCPVPSGATLDDSEATLRLHLGGESPSVELPCEPLIGLTNCHRLDWAVALLEVAIAAGAVSVLVIANEFWKGGPKAFPVIDAESLLRANLDGVLIEVESEKLQLEYTVGDEPIPVAGNKLPVCDDFALAGLDTELAMAHTLEFNLRKGDGTMIPAVWKGFVNVTPMKVARPMVPKRKFMQTMDE